jgi:protein arginine kinase activator
MPAQTGEPQRLCLIRLSAKPAEDMDRTPSRRRTLTPGGAVIESLRKRKRIGMRCQQCDKQATFHITELTGGKPQELHLCEDHARQYLSASANDATATGSMAAVLAQQMAIGQTAEELTRLDQQACPVCGITFYEFRSQGRLGCPHDYVAFQAQLDPLIVNIHGESEHVGKRPRHHAAGSQDRTQLIRLRREMKAAIDEERYERASSLRDEIQRIESEGG